MKCVQPGFGERVDKIDAARSGEPGSLLVRDAALCVPYHRRGESDLTAQFPGRTTQGLERAEIQP